MTPTDDGVVQTFEVNGGRIKCGPRCGMVSGPRLFTCGAEADVIRASVWVITASRPRPLRRGAIPNRGSPGGTLTVSSDGKLSGTGIVLATPTPSTRALTPATLPGVLHAFDAETLRELWKQRAEGGSGPLGARLVKFVPPLVRPARSTSPTTTTP